MYEVCEALMPWNTHFVAKNTVFGATYIISINTTVSLPFITMLGAFRVKYLAFKNTYKSASL